MSRKTVLRFCDDNMCKTKTESVAKRILKIATCFRCGIGRFVAQFVLYPIWVKTTNHPCFIFNLSVTIMPCALGTNSVSNVYYCSVRCNYGNRYRYDPAGRLGESRPLDSASRCRVDRLSFLAADLRLLPPARLLFPPRHTPFLNGRPVRTTACTSWRLPKLLEAISRVA